jgi:2-C-methyl-D-erythritol 2,4-cyclodiphosphate synthase
MRIGYGEDAHRLIAGRPLVIGNIVITDSPHGAAAHSDGDVLLHALADALLSSYALADIGHYFPPSKPEFKDINSAEILRHVLALLSQQGVTDIINVAAVITLDKPKLGSHRDSIAKHVAELLGLSQDRVGISFKTSEGLARGHIQARVTVLLDHG